MGARSAQVMAIAVIVLAIMFSRIFSMDSTERKFIIPIFVLIVLGCAFYYVNSTYMIVWSLTAPARPDAERQFLDVIDQSRQAGASGPAAALATRTARLCALPHAVTGWTGTVDQSYPTVDNAKASLSVRIDRHVILRTAFDFDSTTSLIDAGTPVFTALQSLRQGDAVRFSGNFVPGPDGCPYEGNITADGKLQDPEFLFHFSALSSAK